MAVPRLFPNSTIVCLGGGPSLTQADVDACRDVAHVIAVNDGYRVAPWADALYACDVAWWEAHDGVPSFTGAKWSLDQPNWATKAERWPEIQRLKNAGQSGLSSDPEAIMTGQNSGYQAINLAVLLGASRVLLLGYDMRAEGTKTHWFGQHPGRLHRMPPFDLFLAHFETLVEPARAMGVEIVNCTLGSALRCFRTETLADALPVKAAA